MRTLAILTTRLLFVGALAFLGIANVEGAGATCGVGAVVGPDGPVGTPTLKAIILDHINVTDVIPDGPAAQKGVKKGDEIIEINGKTVVGMNFYDTVTKLIRGESGTSIKITVKRPGTASPLSFVIVRGTVGLPSPQH